MKARVVIETQRYRRAFKALASKSKKNPIDFAKQEAGLFVVEVVRVTPPAQGSLAGAKQKGAAAIRADLASIMFPANSRAAQDPEAVHRQHRDRGTGRVKPGAKRVPVRNLAAYRRRLIASVGILSAGWNPAAQKLGRRLPAWITRHGTSGGGIDIRLGLAKIAIRIRNRVKFAGGVKGFERRVRYAYRRRAIALETRVKNYLFKQAAREAGFKVRG